MSETPPEQKTITRERALDALRQGTEREADERLSAELSNAETKVVELDGRRKFFGLRDKWSTAIIWWISLLIVFNSALTVAVGWGWLKFDNLQWFVTAVTIETFLQTVGLGYVAANFLFSDGTSKASKSKEGKSK